MGHALVSVIIPMFNASGTISRALDSVLGQTFRDYEIILVDDGSSDDVGISLSAYRDKLTFIQQANSGAAAARNRAARVATGHYLAFLDADDFWHVRKLELQLIAFEQHPDISLCWTGHGNWRSGETMPLSRQMTDKEMTAVVSRDFIRMFLSPYLGTPGVMMTKATFDASRGFREDLHSAEDIDLWLRASYQNSTALVPGELFFVVTTANSLAARHGCEAWRNNLRVIDQFCAEHPDFAEAHPDIVRRARAKVYEEWGSDALSDGKYDEAILVLGQSLRNRVSSRSTRLWVKTIVRRILG